LKYLSWPWDHENVSRYYAYYVLLKYHHNIKWELTKQQYTVRINCTDEPYV